MVRASELLKQAVDFQCFFRRDLLHRPSACLKNEIITGRDFFIGKQQQTDFQRFTVTLHPRIHAAYFKHPGGNSDAHNFNAPSNSPLPLREKGRG